ncbi:MAG: flagellar hook-associated protein FlgK [Chitinivibrionia bacterium]|nr:flagellar hook-associated protein FlgK [Chitinivibrionia bacterium]
MSLFSMMNVANRALFASQIGMDVTSQNIANVDTPGYSRKRMNLTAEYHKHANFGQFGFGVQVTNITRIRNEYLDQQIRRQSHELGKNQAIDYALESLENILQEPYSTGILEYMNKFFDSWENLVNNADEVSARTAVRTNASMLVEVFNNIGAEIDKLKRDQNSEIEAVVNQINNIAKDLFQLNSEIAAVEITGNSANDSKDRRDLLLRDLSELIDFDTLSDANGQITILINGNILISPVSINPIEIYEDFNTRINADEGFSQFGIRMSKGRNPINPLGGKLKGLFIARDEAIPKFENQLNELVKTFVTAINDQHKIGFNLNGHTGFNFFDPEGLTLRNIKLSTAVASDVINIAAARGGNSITNVTNELSLGLTLAGGAVNLSRIGVDPTITPPTLDERAVNLVSGSVKVTTGASGSGVVLRENIDYKIDYVYGTIELLSVASPTYENIPLYVSFDYSTGNFSGASDNLNAVDISELRKKLTMAPNGIGEPSVSFDEYFSSTIAELGLDRNESTANITTREYLIEQYDTHQDAIAGVQLDEEMAEMIKYQYTYQGAARIMNAAQAMLDVLMNL